MNLDFILKLLYHVSDFKIHSANGGIVVATDKRQFTLRVQDDVYEKMRYLAYVERRSVAMEIEHAMQEYISRYESLHGSIQIVQPEDLQE